MLSGVQNSLHSLPCSPGASMLSQDYVDLHVKPENFRTCKVQKLDMQIPM